MKTILLTLIITLSVINLKAQDYKFGKISKEELSEQIYPLDSSANAVILYKKRYTHFDFKQNQGFQVVTEVQERIKIYNSEGFDWATKEIKFYKTSSSKENVSNIKAATFVLENNKIIETDLSKKDIFDEEVNKYWSEKKFTMPNLSEGCIVEWKYKITSPFKSIDDVQFQYSIPVKKVDITIEMPEYYVFKKRNKGYFLISPKETTKNSFISINNTHRIETSSTTTRKYSQSKIDYKTKVEIYNIENVPALKEEPYVNNIENYMGAVEYEFSELHWPREPIEYFSNSWDDVTKTIYDNADFKSQLYKSNHYKDDLPLILQSAKTDSEKLVAIFEFVKQKIKWNNYNGFYAFNGVKKAYTDGVGNASDINLNLVSMLNSAGLTANPVLISTRSHGIPLFPTIEGFNFVIAAVELSGGIVLLDATDPNSTPNHLPLRDLNWKGRLIRKDESSVSVDLIPTEPSTSTSNIMVTISGDGEVNGIVRKTYDNLHGVNYRDKYYKVSNDDIITKIESDNNLEIQDFKVTKDNIYKPVIEMYKFNSENMVDMVGTKIYIKPLLFNVASENPFKLEDRKYPIDFGTPMLDKNTVIITIPEGYTISSYPENIAMGLPNNYGVYIFRTSVLGNKVSVQSQLKLNTAIYPSQNYKEMKDFYKMIINKNLENIVLEKTAP